jgi:UDP-glucose 4-epimerase
VNLLVTGSSGHIGSAVAALHVPHLTTASPAEFRRVNVDATRGLLEAATAARVSRFVFLSTTSVYGCAPRSGPPATWVDEGLEPNPEDVYDRTNLAAEALCRTAAGSAMSTVVLRLARCFPEPDPLVAFYRLYRAWTDGTSPRRMSWRS